jgi:hypothetical protein
VFLHFLSSTFFSSFGWCAYVVSQLEREMEQVRQRQEEEEERAKQQAAMSNNAVLSSSKISFSLNNKKKGSLF